MPQFFVIPFLVCFVSFMCIWSKTFCQTASSFEASIMLAPSSISSSFIQTERMLSLLVGMEIPSEDWGKPVFISILSKEEETLFQRQLSWEESLYGGEGITLNLDKRRISIRMGEIPLSQVNQLILEICHPNKPSGTYECSRQ